MSISIEQALTDLNQTRKLQRFLESQLSLVTSQLTEKTSELDALRTDIAGQTSELLENHRTIHELNTTIQNKNSLIQSHRHEITQQRTELTNQAGWINRVKMEVSNLARNADSKDIGKMIEKLHRMVNPEEVGGSAQGMITASQEMFNEMAKFNERLASAQEINLKESENHKRVVSKLTNENSFLLEEINNLRRQVAYLTNEQSSLKARLFKITSFREIHQKSAN